MSEVKVFKCVGYMEQRSRAGGERWVSVDNFDRVNAERDAALETVALKQRDLIEAQTAVTGWARKFDALQALLTAADERADQQSWALLEVGAACDLAMSAMDDDERGANFVQIISAIKAKAALKPAEGGGVYDEMTDADWQLKDDMDRYDDEKERS